MLCHTLILHVVLLSSFLSGIHNIKTFDTFQSRSAKAPIHNESAGAGAWSERATFLRRYHAVGACTL